MRKFRGRTWLNFAATLLLAAVISPMADATQTAVAASTIDGSSPSPHVRMDKVALGGDAGKASNNSTQPRGSATLAVARIPADLNGAVYYDSRQVPPDSTEAVTSQNSGTLLSGAVPGKWTSLLATVLLFGFLFWRRAS